MAGRLMRQARIAAALIGVVIASTCAAENLRDPTRPPAVSAKGAAGKIEPSGWILQSVLISPERRYAIINDEVVRLGGSIAGAELIAVAEERVTLRTREGLRIVHLFPDVTRLGGVDANPGSAKRMRAQEADKNTDAQKPGHSGIKK